MRTSLKIRSAALLCIYFLIKNRVQEDCGSSAVAAATTTLTHHHWLLLLLY